MLLFDIDYFKRFNDTYGHQAGDDCLATFGQLLRDGGYGRRPGDLVARYGGEEFAIILSASDESFAYDLGKQLCDEVLALAIPHANTGVEEVGVVTISVGAASLRSGAGIESADLVAAADAALYRAKRSGRNRCLPAHLKVSGEPPNAPRDSLGRDAAEREAILQPALRWPTGSTGGRTLVR